MSAPSLVRLRLHELVVSRAREEDRQHAVVFILIGLSKLAGPPAMRWAERFMRWGYPAVAARAVDILEILGGIGLLIPRSRRAAAGGLAALMAGALLTHVIHGEHARLVPPLVLGLLTLVAACRPSR